MKLFSFVAVWRIRTRCIFNKRKFIRFCLLLTLLLYLRGTLCIIRAIKIIFRKLNITQSTLKKFPSVGNKLQTNNENVIQSNPFFLFLTFSFSGKLHELQRNSDTQTCMCIIDTRYFFVKIIIMCVLETDSISVCLDFNDDNIINTLIYLFVYTFQRKISIQIF